MATKKPLPKKAIVKTVPAKAVPVKKQSVTIIEFGEETKDLLKQLIEALSPQNIEVREEPVKIVKTQPKKQEEEEPDEEEKPVKKKETKVQLSQIRELITEKATEKKTTGILKTLKKYGAESATQLDESDYDDFYNDLKNV